MTSNPESSEPKGITIGALSRATQIPVETLRTWERRYLSPTPVRKPSGHRLYPVTAIDHLRRVARLLERGHRPREVLGLSIRELDALLALEETAVAPSRSRAGGPVPAGASLERSLREMLRAAAALDRESLMRELRANWVRLGPLRFLDQCAGPFLTGIGEAWHERRIEVRHEHFASRVLSDFLREVREPFDHGARGPRVIAATPPGEAHDGGLLMASVVLSVRGRRVVYLGPDTPIDEIAAAARERSVEAVLLSISSATPMARAKRSLEALRRALPARIAVWVGGRGAPPPSRGVERFETLEELDARLVSRT